jgi:hypothetical protein
MVLALESRARAVAPASRAARAATPLGRTPRPASARRSMRHGTAVPARFLPKHFRHKFNNRGATCPAPTGRSAAVPTPRAAQPIARRHTRRTSLPPTPRRTPAMPRPIPRLSYLDAQVTHPTASRPGIKGRHRPSSRDPEPPPSAMGATQRASHFVCSRRRSSAPSPSPYAKRARSHMGRLARAVCLPEPELPRSPPGSPR